MRRIYLSILALFTGLSVTQAQDHDHAKCLSDHVLQQNLEDPENWHSYQAFRHAAMEYAANPANEIMRNQYGTRIIPVVVHILHDGNDNNITKAQIEDQIRVLNEDFNRLNPDSVNTPERFWGDIEVVEFTIDINDPTVFDDSSTVIRIGNRFGTVYGLHFTDDIDSVANTLVDETIQVNAGSTNSSVGNALETALNTIPGIIASYSDTAGHVIRIEGDTLGFAADPVAVNLDSNITTEVLVNGSLIPGRMNVEFRLARKDPLGNCTEGIVRVFTTKTHEVRDDTGFKAESYWTCTQYLNMWIVESIEHLGIGGSTLGYAQFPASGLCSTDGITMRHDQFGTIGTASGRAGRTTTHEAGHWFGLRHIWGDANCGTDDIADTPTHLGPNFGICGNVGQLLHTTPHNVTNCNPDNWKGEMFSNYMDYSDDVCMNIFTINQVDRMNFTIHGDGNEPGIRSELVSDTNLVKTGTAEPYTEEAGCAPIADFYGEQGNFIATTMMICEGQTVTFEDGSYNSEISNRNWSFPGGSPSTSDDDNPTVEYGSPGTYNVSLSVTGPNGSDQTTFENYVVVSSNQAEYQSSWGYVQAFWDSTSLDDWYIVNHDGAVNGWEWFEAGNGGFSGDQSLRMYNLFNTRAQIDEIISPSYDLSNITDATLSFRYSGATMSPEPSDRLNVFVSKDCGKSWNNRTQGSGEFSGFELTNGGFAAEGYRPGENGPWTVKEIGLGTFDEEENLRIKFQWNAGGLGNHFYIDDITISGSPIGVEEQDVKATWKLAPNPASNSTRMTLDLGTRSNVHMKMYDLMGKEVRDLYHGELAKGSFNLDIDLAGLESGMYVIIANVNDQQITERLIVE